MSDQENWSFVSSAPAGKISAERLATEQQWSHFKVMLRQTAATLLICLAGALPAAAQTSDARMLASKRDLAGVLGEAHFIRTLCNGKSDQYWRNYMADFLKLEGDPASHRSLYIQAFNRGYKFRSTRLSVCTVDLSREEAVLATKGRKLAENIAISYLD